MIFTIKLTKRSNRFVQGITLECIAAKPQFPILLVLILEHISPQNFHF